MDDFRYIRSTTGRVHVLLPNDPDEAVEPVRSGQEFAAVMMDTTRMACGVELHIDWTEVSRRRATPVGEFDDADLCSRCVMAVGDQAEQIFDRDAAWR